MNKIFLQFAVFAFILSQTATTASTPEALPEWKGREFLYPSIGGLYDAIVSCPGCTKGLRKLQDIRRDIYQKQLENELKTDQGPDDDGLSQECFNKKMVRIFIKKALNYADKKDHIDLIFCILNKLCDYALKVNDKEYLLFLIRNRAFEKVTKDKRQVWNILGRCFFNASKRGDAQTIDFLVSLRFFRPSQKIRHKSFMIAVLSGHINVLEKLIKAAKVGILKGYGSEKLIYECVCSTISLAKWEVTMLVLTNMARYLTKEHVLELSEKYRSNHHILGLLKNARPDVLTESGLQSLINMKFCKNISPELATLPPISQAYSSNQEQTSPMMGMPMSPTGCWYAFPAFCSMMPPAHMICFQVVPVLFICPAATGR